MPTLTVTFASPIAGSPTRKAEIACLVTDLVERLLGKRRALAAVTVTEIAAADWWIGGRSLAESGAAAHQVVVRVTQGTNTKAEKARFVAAAHQGLIDLLGPSRPESYVIVEEIPADGWGWGGETQERRSVADALGREEETALVFDAYRRFGIR